MEDDLLFVSRLDANRAICVSHLAHETLDQDESQSLGGDEGFFLYEIDDRPVFGGVTVLAKAASLDAAFRLADLLTSITRPNDHESALA